VSPETEHKFERDVVFTIFDEKLNVIIRQYKEYESEDYKKEISYRLMPGASRTNRTSNDTISEQLDILTNYSMNTLIISAYLNSRKQIILFFTFKDVIKYCAIAQVFNCF
jgi:hypothetical protein